MGVNLLGENWPVGVGLQACRRPLYQTQIPDPPRHCTVTGRGKEIPGLSSYSVLPEMSVWWWWWCVLTHSMRIYTLYVSTVNTMPLCKHAMFTCCIILLWGLFAHSLDFVWWAVVVLWEPSGVEATMVQAWPLDQARGVGLLTGMGRMHFTAPPTTHTRIYSRRELDLAPLI